jgi:hypothetical protein
LLSHFHLQRIAVLLLISCVAFTWHDDPVRTIDHALNQYYQQYPQEKVFLLFDKESYAPGEPLWFKASLTLNGAPSGISKILYVELLDHNGLILRREILPVQEGSASGMILVPADATLTGYQLRAFSTWMMNFGETGYYYRGISINGQPGSASSWSPGDSLGFSMQFFPESGYLVQGLTSRVAFRALDSDGVPVEAAGNIIDSSGKLLSQFKTVHDGMGSFVMHPMPGNDYMAVVTFPGGQTGKFKIPKARKSGIILYIRPVAVEEGPDSVYFRISRSIAEKSKFQNLIICEEMEGKVSYEYINFDSVTAGNYNNHTLTATTPLSLDNFPSGILHLTVFNDSAQPLAQRLIYLNNPASQLQAVLSADLLNTDSGGKNNFTLQVPEDAKGNYAVSVSKADQPQQSDAEENLRSSVLLAEHIQPRVNHPGWYLASNQQERRDALDLLLLCSEWSGFSWDRILHHDYPHLRYFAEPSLSLSGRAFLEMPKGRVPMNNGYVSMIIKAPQDSLTDIISVPVDTAGRFSVVGLDFHDSATISTENVHQKEGKKTRVEFSGSPLDTIYYAGYLPGRHLLGPQDQTLSASASHPGKRFEKDSLAGRKKSFGDTAILNSVTVRSKLRTHTDSVIANYATGIFANPNAFMRTLDFTNDKTTQNLYAWNVIEYLDGRIAGPVFKTVMSGGTIQYLIYWRLTTGLFLQISEAQRIKLNAPAFFLNEQLLNEGSEGYDYAMELLEDIKMADVAMVRIFQPGTMPMVAGDAPHGAIAVYTKNGTEGNFLSATSNFDRIKKAGYAKIPDFYSTGEAASTLYWNPRLLTDSASHLAHFQFLNHEKCKRFHILVQGMDQKGRLVRLEKTIP